MSTPKSEKVLTKDGLSIKSITVDKIYTGDNIRILTEKESDNFFSVTQGIDSKFDWSFSWENVIHGQSTNTFTAPVNGWFSIDKISGSVGNITINNSLSIKVQGDGSFQTILKSGDVVGCDINFNYSFVPCNGEIEK